MDLNGAKQILSIVISSVIVVVSLTRIKKCLSVISLKIGKLPGAIDYRQNAILISHDEGHDA